jgi:hypothetical protein
VAGEVRRLLSGRVELHELVMTGGLWRLTGEQVESAAAEAGPSTEEVRVSGWSRQRRRCRLSRLHAYATGCVHLIVATLDCMSLRALPSRDHMQRWPSGSASATLAAPLCW